MADGFSGMAELLDDLRKLPDELKGEAAKDVSRAAADMSSDLKNAYNDRRFTGNLAKGVKTKVENPLKVRVQSTAPHVYLFEFGSYKSGARFWKSGKSTGTMPGAGIFIPAAQRNRRRMYERLQAMLKKLKVRGMTGTP